MAANQSIEQLNNAPIFGSYGRGKGYKHDLHEIEYIVATKNILYKRLQKIIKENEDNYYKFLLRELSLVVGDETNYETYKQIEKIH